MPLPEISFVKTALEILDKLLGMAATVSAPDAGQVFALVEATYKEVTSAHRDYMDMFDEFFREEDQASHFNASEVERARARETYEWLEKRRQAFEPLRIKLRRLGKMGTHLPAPAGDFFASVKAYFMPLVGLWGSERSPEISGTTSMTMSLLDKLKSACLTATPLWRESLRILPATMRARYRLMTDAYTAVVFWRFNGGQHSLFKLDAKRIASVDPEILADLREIDR